MDSCPKIQTMIHSEKRLGFQKKSWKIVVLFICFLFAFISLDCIQKSSANLEEEAIVQLQDFFNNLNELYERQKRYEFQKILDVKKLDRKRAEVALQYKFIDKYMTVDRTEEVRQSTFLFCWQDKGRLVVLPEGGTRRVRWVLSSTWEYDQDREKALDRFRAKNQRSQCGKSPLF